MNGSLFLTTENPGSPFSDIDNLKKLLADLQLIQPTSSNTALCGEDFAQLVTFMGCSPHLVFEQPEDGSDKYCHVIFHAYQNIRLFTGQQTAPPRCPTCRYRMADWKNDAEQWLQQPEHPWKCPECGQQHAPANLDWRQSGGAGRLLVEIKNIFPGEAVPVDRLMKSLETLSGEKWRFFYLV